MSDPVLPVPDEPMSDERLAGIRHLLHGEPEFDRVGRLSNDDARALLVEVDRLRAAEREAKADIFAQWNTESPATCSHGPHRGPEGPNEDLGQCFWCGSLSYHMRPVGETFGDHLADCSLPYWHESWCVGGGSGHPASRKVRG